MSGKVSPEVLERRPLASARLTHFCRRIATIGR
jgi:hypothetical protein